LLLRDKKDGVLIGIELHGNSKVADHLVHNLKVAAQALIIRQEQAQDHAGSVVDSPMQAINLITAQPGKRGSIDLHQQAHLGLAFAALVCLNPFMFLGASNAGALTLPRFVGHRVKSI